jgi:hypothetical protein
MRTEKGYKITLQFPAKTLEQRQAGEFLERLGSKKSRVVVQALTEYLQKYPNLLEVGGTIHVDATTGLSREEVRAIICEELTRRGTFPSSETAEFQPGAEHENIVDSMLDNLGLFG